MNKFYEVEVKEVRRYGTQVVTGHTVEIQTEISRNEALELARRVRTFLSKPDQPSPRIKVPAETL